MQLEEVLIRDRKNNIQIQIIEETIRSTLHHITFR